jgi:hypothetical protein
MLLELKTLCTLENLCGFDKGKAIQLAKLDPSRTQEAKACICPSYRRRFL